MTLLPNFTVTKNTFFLQVVKIVPVNFIIDEAFFVTHWNQGAAVKYIWNNVFGNGWVNEYNLLFDSIFPTPSPASIEFGYEAIQSVLHIVKSFVELDIRFDFLYHFIHFIN